MSPLGELLAEFTKLHSMDGKGPLCVALVVTQHACTKGLPLDADELLTAGGGQVLGLGKGAVQAVLKKHGITKVLAEEGGRTSRGSVGKMRAYVRFLNELHRRELAELDPIELWWIQRVRTYLAAKPLSLQVDPAKSLRATFAALLDQVEKRQRAVRGATLEGTVLQHLVGAKLDLALPDEKILHRGASVSDKAQGSAADFVVHDVAIHVTAAPSEALMRKCIGNLEFALRPMILTIQRKVGVAESMAEDMGFGSRVDVLGVEQFLVGNVYERGLFEPAKRREALECLVDRYNALIDAHEHDPGLRIEIA